MSPKQAVVLLFFFFLLIPAGLSLGIALSISRKLPIRLLSTARNGADLARTAKGNAVLRPKIKIG